MEVQFKVYAKYTSSGKPEVRRFGIERSVVTNYQYLVAKLEAVFPAIRQKKFTISWKDEEGDDIRISSDEELVLALNSGGDVTKLYVDVECEDPPTSHPGDIEIDLSFEPPLSMVGGCGEPQGPGSEAVHYGVVCDGCEGAVVGFRYRCTVCRDFDLCRTCEAAGKHPEHCMLRIPSPLTPYHQLKTRIKRVHARHMKHMFSEQHCTEKKAEGAECPYTKKQRRDKSGERRHQGGPRRSCRGWMDTVTAYMNEFANLAGDVAAQAQAPAPTPSTSAAAQPAPAPQPSTNAENGETIPPQQATAGAGPTPTNTPSETGEVPLLPPIQLDKLLNPENMKYVLEMQKMLTSILLPHAADDAEMKDTSAGGSRSEASFARASETSQASSHVSSQSSSQAASRAASVVGAPAGAASMVGAPAGAPGGEVTPAAERQSSAERVDGWTMINNENDLMDMPVPQPSAPQPTAPQPAQVAQAAHTTQAAQTAQAAHTAQAAQAQPIGFKDLPRNFNDKLKINDGPGLYPNISQPAQGVTIGTTAIPLPPPSQAPVPPQPQRAPQPAPRLRHPKPHIEAAINQMLGMGFTDEGGWLTQLLESKDGNISAVLDLLTPVQVQRP